MHRETALKPSYQQPRSTLCLRSAILVFVRAMMADRISQAMERIDKALARIETQAALPRPSGAPRQGDSGDLAAQHDRLRENIAASIAELDTLIERLEQ